MSKDTTQITAETEILRGVIIVAVEMLTQPDSSRLALIEAQNKAVKLLTESMPEVYDGRIVKEYIEIDEDEDQ